MGGIFIRSFFAFEYLWLLGALLGVTFVLVGLIQKEKFRHYFLFALLFSFAALGVLRFEISNTFAEKHALDSFAEKRVEARGVIAAEPDLRETNTKLTVRLSSLEGEKIDARVLVTTNLYPELFFGDEILVRGILAKPGTFSEGGREFDYAEYLAKDNIHYLFLFPTVSRVAQGKGSPIMHTLLAVKEKFLEAVSAVIPEPQNALGAGLVLGAKQSLGEEWLERFRISGLIHIVVLSGYNVTLVSDFVTKILSVFPKAVSISAGVAGIIAFAVITGASETTVRASIMALLVIFAGIIKRDYVISRALLVAGFLMLLHNPNVLVFDTSFQLSFLATLGLIYLAPLVEKYFLWVPVKLKLREIVSATIATQVFVLPLLLYTTGLFSLVSLPANLLVLPTVSFTMLFYFLTGLSGLLSPILSLPFAYASHALLSYQLFIADFFSSLPLSAVSVESFSTVLLAVSYTLLAFFIWRIKRSAVAA